MTCLLLNIRVYVCSGRIESVMRETKHHADTTSPQALCADYLAMLSDSLSYHNRFRLNFFFPDPSYHLILSSICFVSWLILCCRLVGMWGFDLMCQEVLITGELMQVWRVVLFLHSLTSGHEGFVLRLSHELFVKCENNNSYAHQSQDEQDKHFL